MRTPCRLGFLKFTKRRTPLLTLIAPPCNALLPRFHDVRITPDHKAPIRHVHAVLVGIRVKRPAVAEVTLVRRDVVGNAANGKGTLEDGRTTCVRIALIVHGDACPAEHVTCVVRGAGSIGAHALRRDVRGDDLAPVCFDGGRKEWFRVREDALASRVGVIVDDARRRVYEVVVWAEMEEKGFAKSRECQSEGIGVV
jgi:hypothetical protein